MIKRFNDFIKEEISTSSTDRPSVATAINSINKLQDDIKDFHSKKSQLRAIYMSAKNEKELIQSLFRQKFIKQPNDKTKMEFSNNFLQKYSNVCDYLKQATDKQKEIDDLEKKNSELESSISSNPTSEDSIKKDVGSNNTLIQKIKNDMADLSKRANDMEREMNSELVEMQRKVKSDQSIIQAARSIQTSNK
jgi:chromosome segregation ATPase